QQRLESLPGPVLDRKLFPRSLIGDRDLRLGCRRAAERHPEGLGVRAAIDDVDDQLQLERVAEPEGGGAFAQGPSTRELLGGVVPDLQLEAVRLEEYRG